MERKRNFFYVLGNWLKINGKRNLMRIFFCSMRTHGVENGLNVLCGKEKLPKMSKVETFSLQTFSCGKSFSFLLIFYFHKYVYILFPLLIHYFFFTFIPPYFSFMQLFLQWWTNKNSQFSLFFPSFFSSFSWE